MKEKIERLSKGIFEYEMPELQVSETELNLFVEAGMKQEGRIRIGNSEGQRMKGVFYVTGKLLELDRTDFIGTDCEVCYRVDASTLQPGEEHVGTISIVSDCGECRVPFSIRVTDPSFDSSIGVIHDLFQFTNLARSNWNEALELFYSPNFPKVVLQKESRYCLAYEQLYESTDKSLAMEEFLVLVHKKKECDFQVSVSCVELEAASENFMEYLSVRKEQWGYLNISVTTDAPYLSLAKHEISSEDFVNGQAQLEFVVEAEKLRCGNYFTEIVLCSGRKTVRIPVKISCHKNGASDTQFKKSMHHLEYRLMEQYLQFRNDSISSGNFLSESSRLLESILLLLDKQDMESADVSAKTEIEERRFEYELYSAYLSIVDEKNRAGDDSLALVLSRKSYFERNHKSFYCAVLYLEAMKSRNRAMVEEYAEIIRSYYESEKKENLLLWFLLYMDKRLENSRLLRYEAIKQHCRNGMCSPVLLYEAAAVWNADPMMITSLTSFECQVMHYMVEHGTVSRETALQFAFLSDRKTDQELLQIRILKKLYAKFQNKDILLALCKKLIRQNCRSSKNHTYFRQGVKEQLKLDQLYEYYILTLDKSANQAIDQQVLLYFSISNFQSDEDAAYVYSYVVRNKDSNPAIYRAYLKRMEQFAVNQMKAGVITSYHAVLYADVLRSSIIDREMAQILPDIIFTYQIECSSPSMQSVCVAHKEEKAAQVIPLIYKNGVRQAMVPIYTDNSEIFLVDERGRRYLMSGEDKLYRLMHAENFLDTCYEMGSDNRKLLLHIWEKNKNYNRQDKLLIDLQKQISRMHGLREEIQNSCIVALVDYYYENYNVELLESYLDAVNLKLLSTKDREKMLELMILRDMYDKVIENVEMFGCSTTMQPKRISKICVRGISSSREEKDRSTLLTMGFFAFHNGRIEERLLQYLADRYNGTTEEMYELWKAAKSRELETTSLEERLLAQMLFAESYVDDSFEVFVSYCRTGMNRKLIRAYFSYCAYKYFVKGRVTNSELFEMMKKESFLESNQICVLALLKYYAGKETLLEAEKAFVNYYIQKLVQKKLIYGFFKEFEGKVALPACMQDKYYVEYRSNPKNKLVLHYSNSPDEGCFRKEEMKDIGYGIFGKELILFYGESLQYFITEENEEEVEVVESKVVNCMESDTFAGATKYGKINEILMTLEMQDEKTLLSLLEQYYKEEYAVKRHFSPV